MAGNKWGEWRIFIWILVFFAAIWLASGPEPASFDHTTLNFDIFYSKTGRATYHLPRGLLRWAPRKQIITALEEQLKEYEKRYGKSKSSKVYIVEAKYLFKNVIGYYFPRGDIIYLIAGNYYEAPAFYHELHHLNSGDLKHTSSFWKQIDKEGDKIRDKMIVNSVLIRRRELRRKNANKYRGCLTYGEKNE